jgi:glycosyltransferase involved in cell wall biosynthesis
VKTPRVSVICLCYNHADFVEESIHSVLRQTWPNIQIIAVDDHSTDHSASVLQQLHARHPEIELLLLPENLGNCGAFNRGLALAKGDYIIDLAADDLLEPERIAVGVARLEAEAKETGIHFSNAIIISQDGKEIGRHADRFPHDTIPQGDVYAEVLRRYFICSPTIMMRRAVLEQLHGYDETLAYEDFDLWVRAARNFWFVYSPEALVRKRRVTGSLGQRQFKRGDKQAASTYRVCVKAKDLNRTESEWSAWRERIRYEMWSSLRRGALGLAWQYLRLL